jgi:hypothetical protein
MHYRALTGLEGYRVVTRGYSRILTLLKRLAEFHELLDYQKRGVPAYATSIWGSLLAKASLWKQSLLA